MWWLVTGQVSGIAALAVPDVYLDDSHLAAARAVLDRVVGLDKTLLAYVSGSLAAGLGHGKSDVDLYVATAAGAPADCSYREAGTVVQVNPVTADQLELIAATCSEYTDTAESRPQIHLTDTALQRPVRWAIGTVIVDNGAALPSPADSRTAIRRLLMNKNAYHLSSLAEDTLGALEISDALTALQASALSLELAIECALAASGDLYVSRKFLLRRLARSPALRDVLADAWELLRQPARPGSLAGVAELAVRRMLLCSHLVSRALLDGWDRPAEHIGPFADRRAGGGPVRSPWVMPVRFADAWGMTGPQSGYRTMAGMVRLWHSLNGQATAQVHRELARDSPGEPVTRELLDSAIAQLIENGAAVPDSGSIRVTERRCP